ncbi:MAG TPA: cyclic nucleotide-binding domain-containing protein [Gallionellaceae bacterium]|nr:cyclic nucleotide-binding domain-containing protein [Gallionellaceae bacterium]
MDDLDFLGKPEKSTPQDQLTFDPRIALAFFRLQGKPRQIKAGDALFAENEKSHAFLLQRSKMYLLTSGTIQLSVQGKAVGVVKAGEIFGEMASLTQMPRTATATAATDCNVIALDDKQFKSALQEQPEFALTLMVLMTWRMRKMLAASAARVEGMAADAYPMLDKNLLAELSNELGENAVMRYPEGKAIVEAGQSGLFMYIVLAGQISIRMRDRIVEEIGPGGIFGEMALVDSGERMGTAIAETNCEVLAVSRATFLDLVRSNPEFGLAILSTIGERLRNVAASFGGNT